MADTVTFSFPRDFDSTLEYRRLVRGLVAAGEVDRAAREQAFLIGVLLFRQLAYIPAGGRAGFLHARDAGLFRQDAGRHGEQVIEHLVAAELLVPDVAGSGWECPLFTELNRHLEPGRVPVARRNALFMHHDRRLAKAAGAVSGQMDLPMWKNADGSDMDADTARTVLLAIRAIDSGLNLSERPEGEEHWPASLVAGVASLVAGNGIDRVLEVARGLLAFDPTTVAKIPRTTEQLLAHWQDVSALVPRKR